MYIYIHVYYEISIYIYIGIYWYILVYIGYIGSMIEYGPKVDFFKNCLSKNMGEMMAKERGEPPTLALLVVLSPITPRPFSIDDVLKTPCFSRKPYI